MSRLIVLICFAYSFFGMSCSDVGDKKNKEQKINGTDVGDDGAGGQGKEVPEFLSPREYVSWIEDKNNGLKVEKKIGEFTYMFQYKPTDYVVAMDLKMDSISKAIFQKKGDEYSGLQYFNFRISTESGGELLKKNVADERDYYGRIQYFSFDMQNDLKLIDGKDTLKCLLFHFERVFGLAPYATFLLGFPVSQNRENKTLFYDDKIFGLGRIYLTVQSKNINKLPSLIVN